VVEASMDREPKEHTRIDWLAFLEGAAMRGYEPAGEGRDANERIGTPAAVEEATPRASRQRAAKCGVAKRGSRNATASGEATHHVVPSIRTD
jgi:hypothetical protein